MRKTTPNLMNFKMKNLTLSIFAAVMTAVLSAGDAFGFEPKPAELGLQPAASASMERLEWFHDHVLMIIITGITVFVMILLLWVILRYNAKANPVPSKVTHNVPLEIVWTAVPVIILIIVAIPSFKLLYYLDRVPTPEMTLKVSGYQWGWTYTYPDQGDIEFNADYIVDEELDEYIPNGQGRRLLETYNPVVLPTGKDIQVVLTASDVIHAWTVPAFGAKKDAVPGRLNEMWFNIKDAGVYAGQCSEICGIRHAYMPISVYAVPEDEFKAWVSCVQGDGAKADYPARACVKTLGLDKYRGKQVAVATPATTEEKVTEEVTGE